MKDASERDLEAGQYIVYAISAGRNAILRYGKILFASDSLLECLTAEKSFDYQTGAHFKLQNKGKVVRLTTGWNKLIVPREALPIEVQELLQ